MQALSNCYHSRPSVISKVDLANKPPASKPEPELPASKPEPEQKYVEPIKIKKLAETPSTPQEQPHPALKLKISLKNKTASSAPPKLVISKLPKMKELKRHRKHKEKEPPQPLLGQLVYRKEKVAAPSPSMSILFPPVTSNNREETNLDEANEARRKSHKKSKKEKKEKKRRESEKVLNAEPEKVPSTEERKVPKLVIKRDSNDSPTLTVFQPKQDTQVVPPFILTPPISKSSRTSKDSSNSQSPSSTPTSRNPRIKEPIIAPEVDQPTPTSKRGRKPMVPVVESVTPLPKTSRQTRSDSVPVEISSTPGRKRLVKPVPESKPVHPVKLTDSAPVEAFSTPGRKGLVKPASEPKPLVLVNQEDSVPIEAPSPGRKRQVKPVSEPKPDVPINQADSLPTEASTLRRKRVVKPVSEPKQNKTDSVPIETPSNLGRKGLVKPISEPKLVVPVDPADAVPVETSTPGRKRQVKPISDSKPVIPVNLTDSVPIEAPSTSGRKRLVKPVSEPKLVKPEILPKSGKKSRGKQAQVKATQPEQEPKAFVKPGEETAATETVVHSAPGPLSKKKLLAKGTTHGPKSADGLQVSVEDEIRQKVVVFRSVRRVGSRSALAASTDASDDSWKRQLDQKCFVNLENISFKQLTNCHTEAVAKLSVQESIPESGVVVRMVTDDIKLLSTKLKSLKQKSKKTKKTSIHVPKLRIRLGGSKSICEPAEVQSGKQLSEILSDLAKDSVENITSVTEFKSTKSYDDILNDENEEKTVDEFDHTVLVQGTNIGNAFSVLLSVGLENDIVKSILDDILMSVVTQSAEKDVARCTEKEETVEACESDGESDLEEHQSLELRISDDEEPTQPGETFMLTL